MNGNNDSVELKPGITPVSLLESIPAVKIAQFLSRCERDALYTVACANQPAFHQTGEPGSDTGGSFYLSLDSNGCDRPGVAPVREAAKLLSKRILEIIPSLFTALDIEPFAVSEVPMTLLNGLDGHFGLPHADSYDDRFRISLVYYFHRAPKAFRGGDLEFYDVDTASPQGYSDKPLATLAQEDNLLIAFPSQTFHGITNVRCDSDDFADGRFAAVMFLGAQGTQY